MSEQNKNLVQIITEAFSKGHAETVSGYIDENIKWNIVGMPEINGKKDFLDTIKLMELVPQKENSYEKNYPDITLKNIIAEGDYVVVESSGSLNTNQEEPFTPSCCSIYFIMNGKIRELTTYMVDVSLNK